MIVFTVYANCCGGVVVVNACYTVNCSNGLMEIVRCNTKGNGDTGAIKVDVKQ